MATCLHFEKIQCQDFGLIEQFLIALDFFFLNEGHNWIFDRQNACPETHLGVICEWVVFGRNTRQR